MEINSSLILLRSVFISISCTDSVRIFQQARRLRLRGAEGPEFMRCTRNTFKDTVWELPGREMKNARGEGGRWLPPLREHAAISRQPGKCSNGPYKWHPASPVSSWTTLIPPLGLYSESQTPTYTVKRKGYFWKMGPTSWFNSLTNPRKRGFSPLGGHVI